MVVSFVRGHESSRVTSAYRPHTSAVPRPEKQSGSTKAVGKACRKPKEEEEEEEEKEELTAASYVSL